MRTTVDVDPELLAEALSASGERSRSRVINRALRELIRSARLRELRDIAGKIEFEYDWEEMHKREVELEEEEFRNDWGIR